MPGSHLRVICNEQVIFEVEILLDLKITSWKNLPEKTPEVKLWSKWVAWFVNDGFDLKHSRENEKVDHKDQTWHAWRPLRLDFGHGSDEKSLDDGLNCQSAMAIAYSIVVVSSMRYLKFQGAR
jgi:hypothetical protein